MDINKEDIVKILKSYKHRNSIIDVVATLVELKPDNILGERYALLRTPTECIFHIYRCCLSKGNSLIERLEASMKDDMDAVPFVEGGSVDTDIFNEYERQEKKEKYESLMQMILTGSVFILSMEMNMNMNKKE